MTPDQRMMPARKPVRSWPVLLLALPAFVAIWSGWVGLGEMTGFGLVNLLPGIVGDGKWSTINTAITLPVGVETYAAYALHVWLSGRVPARARQFAMWSAIGSLAFGAAGQVAYHLLRAGGVTSAPWQITTLVACLPVAVLGMGAALAHLVRANAEGVHSVDSPAEVSGVGQSISTPMGEEIVSAMPDTPVTPPKRPARRQPKAVTAAAKVAKAAARMPDATPAQVAAKAGVSESTARRHMPSPAAAEFSAVEPGEVAPPVGEGDPGSGDKAVSPEPAPTVADTATDDATVASTNGARPAVTVPVSAVTR